MLSGQKIDARHAKIDFGRKEPLGANANVDPSQSI